MLYVYELSSKEVNTIFKGTPDLKLLERSLNSLQNCMMLIPRWPSAGPNGGDGVAPHAGIRSFSVPIGRFIKNLILNTGKKGIEPL